MSNLIDFFQTITGLSLDWSNPALQVLACVCGFVIVYDVVHSVFGSLFGFTTGYRK